MSDTLTKEQVVRVPCVHSACKGKGSYRVGAKCTNCDWTGHLEITKGHEFSRWIACPRCECTYTLMRSGS